MAQQQKAVQEFQSPESSYGASSVVTGPWRDLTEVVDESAVHGIPGGPSAAPQELAGAGFTYRHDWGNKRGTWKLNLNWGAVSPRSRVFVAIAEGAPGGPDGGKFVGAAKFTLHNVAPRAGGVDIWVTIDWGSDIRIYVDYLVINP